MEVRGGPADTDDQAESRETPTASGGNGKGAPGVMRRCGSMEELRRSRVAVVRTKVRGRAWTGRDGMGRGRGVGWER